MIIGKEDLARLVAAARALYFTIVGPRLHLAQHFAPASLVASLPPMLTSPAAGAWAGRASPGQARCSAVPAEAAAR